jgi:hypothetical protein
VRAIAAASIPQWRSKKAASLSRRRTCLPCAPVRHVPLPYATGRSVRYSSVRSRPVRRAQASIAAHSHAGWPDTVQRGVGMSFRCRHV